MGVSSDLPVSLLTVWLCRLVSNIRREKATSNICTAQALLIVTGAYAMYHGPEGLRAIANRLHTTPLCCYRAEGCGYGIAHDTFFDTVVVEAAGRADELVAKALEAGETSALRREPCWYFRGESHGEELLKGLVEALGGTWVRQMHSTICPLSCCVPMSTQHPIFHKYRSRPR